MSCTSLVSISKDCNNNSGGLLNKIWTNDQDNITGTTIDSANWKLTALTNTVAFSIFEFKKNVGNYTEEQIIDLNNGSSYVKSTITIPLHRRDAAKSKALKILSEGQRYLAIVVGDTNGKYWYFPNAQLISNTGGSGTTRADGSKYEIQFVAENDDLAYEVDEAFVVNLTQVNS